MERPAPSHPLTAGCRELNCFALPRKYQEGLNPPVLAFMARQTRGLMVLLLFGRDVPARFRALIFEYNPGFDFMALP
jgi:hypothetical protein